MTFDKWMLAAAAAAAIGPGALPDGGVGAAMLATLVTEPTENTFPRLPVREGEHVLVRFTTFRDRGSHARWLAALAAWPAWRRAEGVLLRVAPRGPDLLRLAPTARSRSPL
ncbi:hypothetical protein [Luteimonas salinilitoris]|uniref:Uncharacterized protein n=1 Tax=Luteimonas salinilitoris TaxID=3237697 RepID=A0ABV4HNN5_9GAMM